MVNKESLSSNQICCENFSECPWKHRPVLKQTSKLTKFGMHDYLFPNKFSNWSSLLSEEFWLNISKSWLVQVIIWGRRAYNSFSFSPDSFYSTSDNELMYLHYWVKILMYFPWFFLIFKSNFFSVPQQHIKKWKVLFELDF